MIDPYALSFINVCLSLTLFAGVLIYRYVFPKKKINLLILLILISILPVWSIFRPGVYESGDFNIHIYRSISFFTSLTDGQIFPNWSRDLNATYGYETFIIGAPLMYYITSLFHVVGFSFTTSLKILLALAYVTSGITMYLWLKEGFNKLVGFVGGIFYLYAPFHLVDLHFRVSPGDLLVYALLPLAAFVNLRLINKAGIRYFMFSSLIITLLMISHPISLVAMTFIALYLILIFYIYKYPFKYLYWCILSLLLGLFLSAFYWLPVILEKKYIITSVISQTISFEKFSYFFISPWKYGLLFQGPKGELTFLIGYIQIFLIIMLLIYLYKKKLKKKEAKISIFFLTYLAVIIFLFNPISEPVWNTLPLYKSLEFSYRLSFIVVVLTSVIAAITVSKTNKKIIIVICAFAIFSTILNWGHRKVIPHITDKELINNLPYSTFQNEGGTATTTIWVDPKHPWMSEIPKQHLEVIQGQVQIKEIQRITTNHVYSLYSITNSYLKENTYFYPGWVLKVDGKNQEINFKNQKYPGIITFNLKSGLHKVELTFIDTPIRYYSKLLSFFSLLLLILIVYFNNKKKWL